MRTEPRPIRMVTRPSQPRSWHMGCKPPKTWGCARRGELTLTKPCRAGRIIPGTAETGTVALREGPVSSLPQGIPPWVPMRCGSSTRPALPGHSDSWRPLRIDNMGIVTVRRWSRAPRVATCRGSCSVETQLRDIAILALIGLLLVLTLQAMWHTSPRRRRR
jgi:hypothetical protein